MSTGQPGFMDLAGEDATPPRLQPVARPEVFTAGVIYIVQVCIWATSRLQADTVITLDLQTSSFFVVVVLNCPGAKET